jgi:hypothetical protein
MKFYLHAGLLLSLVLFAGCSARKHQDNQSRSTIDSLSNSVVKTVDTAAQIKSDTDETVISGPTVLAYFSISQRDVENDTNYRQLEALADFQHYINNTRGYLSKNGIELSTNYKDTIKYRSNNIPEIFAPKGRLHDVGYIFLDSNKEQEVYYGVMTDYELLSYVERFFKRDSLISNYKRPD